LRVTGLDARGLAKILKKYEIRSKNVRVAGAVVKGYAREDFADDWSRYLPPPPHESATPATSATGGADRASCAVCLFPLNPALAAAGDTMHPSCGTAWPA
jgi:hypothetical protein